MNSFSSFDIKRILGINIDLLKDYRRFGYITPSIQEADGRGTKSLYSFGDLCRIVLFRQLVDRGFAREKAAEIIRIIFSVTSKPYFESKNFGEQAFYVAVITRDESNDTGVAFIPEKAFSNSFEKIFLRVDDIHKTKDVSELSFGSAIVLNLKKVRDFVTSKID
ncbi:MerR family transcriptional regulator [Desulfococcus sp.]|uniref:MerR family transcriptional regulator n=1 Tax=Desulfococcus sp. TaxID=2025834 RepID=UPI003593FAA9